MLNDHRSDSFNIKIVVVWFKKLAPVIQKVDNVIYWINVYKFILILNFYSVDGTIGSPNMYPLGRIRW